MKLRTATKNIMRVLRVASKPSKHEYWASFKITGIGILLIGFLGFMVLMIFRLTGLFA